MNVNMCGRCLLFEHNAELARNVREYINGLPDDIRTNEGEYARRLDICKTCADLINGMCALCGCFVEARAAKRNAHCAKSVEIW